MNLLPTWGAGSNSGPIFFMIFWAAVLVAAVLIEVAMHLSTLATGASIRKRLTLSRKKSASSARAEKIYVVP